MMTRKSTTLDSKYLLKHFWKHTGWTGLLLGIAYQIWNASRIGTYWDFEGDHSYALVNLAWLENGVDAKEPLFQHLKPYGYALTYLMWIPPRIYYWIIGVDFNVAAHGENYLAYRNVFVYLVYLAGVFALAIWFRMVSKAPYYFTIFFTLFAFPTISGHAFMNAKDVPIFAGVACALALSRTSAMQVDKKSKFLNVLLINLAVLFILGVRPGATYLLFTILLLQLWQSRNRRKFLKIVIYGLPSIAYCYLASATAMNFGFFWLWETMTSSTNFTAWQGTMLLWGDAYQTPMSRLYQFGVLLSQVPIYLVVVTGISSALFIRKNLKSLKSARKILEILKEPTSLPALIFCLLMVYVFVSSPMIYDDARQTLFIWALLIPITFTAVSFTSSQLRSKLIFALMVILVSLPVIDSFKLAPYTYAYRNELAKMISPNGFETDYWGLSGKESSKWILSNLGEESVIVSNPLIVYKSFVPQPWKDLNSPQPNAFIYQQIRRPFGVPEMFSECKLLHTISRKPLIGESMIMGWIRKCDFSQINDK